MTTYDNGEGSRHGMEKLQMPLPDETVLTWKEDQEVVSVTDDKELDRPLNVLARTLKHEAGNR